MNYFHEKKELLSWRKIVIIMRINIDSHDNNLNSAANSI